MHDGALPFERIAGHTGTCNNRQEVRVEIVANVAFRAGEAEGQAHAEHTSAFSNRQEGCVEECTSVAVKADETEGQAHTGDGVHTGQEDREGLETTVRRMRMHVSHAHTHAHTPVHVRCRYTIVFTLEGQIEEISSADKLQFEASLAQVLGSKNFKAMFTGGSVLVGIITYGIPLAQIDKLKALVDQKKFNPLPKFPLLKLHVRIPSGPFPKKPSLDVFPGESQKVAQMKKKEREIVEKEVDDQAKAKARAALEVATKMKIQDLKGKVAKDKSTGASAKQTSEDMQKVIQQDKKLVQKALAQAKKESAKQISAKASGLHVRPSEQDEKAIAKAKIKANVAEAKFQSVSTDERTAELKKKKASIMLQKKIAEKKAEDNTVRIVFDKQKAKVESDLDVARAKVSKLRYVLHAFFAFLHAFLAFLHLPRKTSVRAAERSRQRPTRLRRRPESTQKMPRLMQLMPKALLRLSAANLPVRRQLPRRH